MSKPMSDADFFKRLREQHEANAQTIRDALQRAPGTCTVVYHVRYVGHTRRFDTLQDAMTWACNQQTDGNCYVEKYILSDGTELLDTITVADFVR